MKLRHWRADLATDLPPPRVTAEGIVYTGRAARTGEHAYPWGLERRDAAELARVAEQLVGKPLVFLHPPDKVDPKTPIKERVLTARVDGDHVIVEVLVTDIETARELAAGTKELSLGYDVRVDAEGWHRDTVVDHLALVPRGRCGSTCALRTDATDDAKHAPCACGGGMLHEDGTRGQARMLTEDEMKAKIAAAEAERDIAKQTATAATKRADAAEAERDAERVRAEKAEKARADAATVQPEAVRERVALVVKAAEVLVGADGKAEDVSAKSNREIRCAIVKRLDGFDIPADKSEDYVTARYDGCAERPNPLKGLTPAAPARADAANAAIPDPDAARRKMEAETNDRAKRPTEVK